MLASSPALHSSRAQIVALQSAMDMESFWRASVNLVSKGLPGRSCALYSDIVNFEPMQMRYHVVAPRKPDYAPARSLSVSGPYLARHPRIESCTFAEIAAADPWARQRRLEQEPDPEWSDFVALAFWRKTQPHSVLAVFGPERIREEEKAFLDYLRPMMQAGLTRLQTLDQERTLGALLQGYLQNSPEALVFFDQRGTLRYHTTHGEAEFDRWNRALHRGQERSSLPAALRAVFQGKQGALCLQHPVLAELSAVLDATPGGYLLRFTDSQTQGRAADLSPQAIAVLQKLSPAEQRVARLTLEGLRNDQIAERLSRSRRTVEFQLHSTFRKLGIGTRMQLLRLLT